ncbi:MAG TPA: 2-C-methyl-D-erythritol 4-phosphate cytidylyltransferase [bacterium]|nr:2-C-methyl-D-erythritol 4-phosphate cytidylyltransferase [bacterium]
MTLAAILVAAGQSSRFGGGVSKVLRRCGDLPLIAHAAQALLAADGLTEVAVAARPEDCAAIETALAFLRDRGLRLAVVAGGAERQDSVANALAVLTPAVTHVIEHDAARPFPPAALVARVVAALAAHDAVIPVIPVVDTIKEVAGDTVVRTPVRSALRAVQTPQGFRRTLLAAALAAAQRDRVTGTDDAMLVERLQLPVYCVAGDPANRKVTTQEDSQWLPHPLT